MAIGTVTKERSLAQPATVGEPGRRWSPPAAWRRHAVGLSPLVCLLGLVVAGLGEWLAWPAAPVLAAHVVAYLGGGLLATRTGLLALRERQINVDLLMVLAALGAASIGAWQEGGILLFLFSLSNALQAYAMDRTRRAIARLMDLRPDTATISDADGERQVPVESVAIGDLILVRPGDRLPLDGVITSGATSIDQAPITGESLPVDRQVGDTVFAGTINQAGAITVRATKTAGESTLARIVHLVVEAQRDKAPSQRWIERVEQRYAAAVIGITLLAIALPPLWGEDFASSFYRAMTLMVVASPCALAMAMPAALLSAIANAARHGVLFKGGAYLETLASPRAVALDKTGTLTTGRPRVADLAPLPGVDAADLLRVAASLERYSEHPIAAALVAAARERGLDLSEPTGVTAVIGRGVRGEVDGQATVVGAPALLAEIGLRASPDLLDRLDRARAAGQTAMVVAAGRPLGVIAVADSVRPAAAGVIARLRRLGVRRIVMLTGDHRAVAERLAARLGIDEVRADLLPDQKQAAIAALVREEGQVVMVGDGVNDAPALATATVGVAMGAAGTDVALETADVVLMSDDLTKLAYAIDLSRRARRIVIQNLAFALLVIIVLALATLADSVTLPLGVLGHEGSTVLVILNSLRLLLVREEAAAA